MSERASLFATVATHGGMRLARDELRSKLNVAVAPWEAGSEDGKLWFSTALGLHALSCLKIPERLCVSVASVPAPDDAWCASLPLGVCGGVRLAKSRRCA
jgi:hypothetical protein